MHFVSDCPYAWRVLIRRLYPPHTDFTYGETISVLPLIDRLNMDWLNTIIKKFLLNSEWAEERKPSHADITCGNGLSEVVEKWFQEDDWAWRHANNFVKGCESATALRSVSLFLAKDRARLLGSIKIRRSEDNLLMAKAPCTSLYDDLRVFQDHFIKRQKLMGKEKDNDDDDEEHDEEESEHHFKLC